MKKPKYNIGDKVWHLEGGSLKEVKIVGIMCTGYWPLYKIRYYYTEDWWYDESRLFPSKETLIKSLT